MENIYKVTEDPSKDELIQWLAMNKAWQELKHLKIIHLENIKDTIFVNLN